jgi:hypothetical protein
MYFSLTQPIRTEKLEIIRVKRCALPTRRCALPIKERPKVRSTNAGTLDICPKTTQDFSGHWI